MKQLLFALTCILFMGCAKFVGTDKSVWSEGLWILPLLFVIAILLLLVSAFRSSKSGSEQQLPGQGMTDTKGNVKLTSTWQFWGAAILTLILIGIVIYQNGQK